MKRDATLTFVDLLDPNRVLVLSPNKSDNADHVTARVYWNKNVAGKVLRVFGGTTTLPRHLLLSGEDTRRAPPRYYGGRGDGAVDQRDRIGYLPEAAYQRRVETERQSERRHHREDENE